MDDKKELVDELYHIWCQIEGGNYRAASTNLHVVIERLRDDMVICKNYLDGTCIKTSQCVAGGLTCFETKR